MVKFEIILRSGVRIELETDPVTLSKIENSIATRNNSIFVLHGVATICTETIAVLLR
jgi:hypothetical protein